MRLLYIFFLVLLAFRAEAQSNIDIETLDEIYECAENRVLIHTSGFPDSNLIIVPSRGQIQKASDSSAYYIWEITELDTPIVTLRVFSKYEHLLVDQHVYWLRPIPAPIPELHKERRGITLKINDFEPNIISFKLIGFEVVYYNAQYKYHRVLYNNGNRFNDDVQGIINNVAQGDRIIFNKFKYCVCDTHYRFVHDPLIFKIK